MTTQTDRESLLAAHAALPEAYQPAWGLDESRGAASRQCEDRLAVIMPLLLALPDGQPLRVLDVGCAQGYFTLAIAHALIAHGRAVEVVGLDSLQDNIRFCEALAVYHRIDARFLCERFDAGFFDRHEGVRFDVVLVLNVLHHISHEQGAASAHDVVEAIRARSEILLCELAQREEALEWVGGWHAGDDRLLDGYAFRRRLAFFSTHLTDVQRPLYVCSDVRAWVGDRWFAFDRVSARAHADVPDAFAGQRRFFIGNDVLVKAYRGDGRYGAFNRAELQREVENLAGLAGEPDRYPEILAQADDGDVLWMARTLLHGDLLSERIRSGAAFDRDAVVRGLLAALVQLEAHGFHHDDLRCWNVLIDAGEVRLIDFGALTREPSPLQRIALAAVLAEIARGELGVVQTYYASLPSLAAYPSGWHALICHLLETPQDSFTCAEALRVFEASAADARDTVVDARLAPAAEMVAAAARAQSEGFLRLQEHTSEIERQLSDALTHARSLQQALDVSQEYVASLREHLQDKETQLSKMDAAVRVLNARLARFQRRFRWLKPLWPSDPRDQA